ncbi:homocysteine-responsive endoplasmic reticulum-resident ubiquitin-like domain member 2 protein isoform X2 [Scyliorhinus canicula]|uniref:homocysteine-responsive endoplasmic reticulum-resident ubiquitin-like domain member 2 protein isoform X2 n=1 Tax=Scyliorhinus canicula TaxID=7830 RepID=UPI0018F7A572|nr:homocysteine-responsive endoplasmic reticulum-resident ubiquitin-like domain member 2 protein isoform X2 [Scyliorhinus canicula]
MFCDVLLAHRCYQNEVSYDLVWSVGLFLCCHGSVSSLYRFRRRESTKDQRLVYSGKLLPDHLQLKDIFRKQDEYHMVHLVCSSRTPPGSPTSSYQGNGTSATNSGTMSSENSSTTTASSSPSQEAIIRSTSRSSTGIRHRNFSQVPLNHAQSHGLQHVMQGHGVGQVPIQPGIPGGFPVYSMYSPQHVLWWQQMYARQYYMQYQAAARLSASASTQPSSPAASEPVNPQPNRPDEAQAVPIADVPENRPINQNIQMNAQGGPVLNEEDLNHDWLDWMYTVSRAGILLSIVYFYSSFSRFVMVMGAILLVYLHQAGWFPFRHDAQNRRPANQPVEFNQEGQEDNALEVQEMERLMDDDSGESGESGESGDDTTESTAGSEPPGFMASAWSFITTFFTSLIPEGPPQVGN